MKISACHSEKKIVKIMLEEKNVLQIEETKKKIDYILRN